MSTPTNLLDKNNEFKNKASNPEEEMKKQVDLCSRWLSIIKKKIAK